MVSDRSTAQQRLIEAGELLYGPQFKLQLAAALGVSQALVAAMVTGDRSVTAETEQRLVDLILSETTGMQKRAARLLSIAEAIRRAQR